MSTLHVHEYETKSANCDGKCDIDESKAQPDNLGLLPCVTCPFCKEVVTAIITEDTISCPDCKTTVRRGNRG